MSGPEPLPPAMEIANLEHELAVLRERHAGMLVNARRADWLLKYGGAATLAVAIAGMAYAGVTGDDDALIMLFVFTAIAVLAGLLAWLCHNWFGKNVPAGLAGLHRYPFRSQEEFFNYAIAVREKRLKELRAQL
jgi:hypothetical protein